MSIPWKRMQGNYKRLDRLFDLQEFREEVKRDGYAHRRLVSAGWMNLEIDSIALEDTGNGNGETLTFAMAHRFEQNGDLCPDPEMVIRIIFSGTTGYAEAIEFETHPFPRHYVYPAPGRYFPKERSGQNSFLETWLKNLAAQGHKLEIVNA